MTKKIIKKSVKKLTKQVVKKPTKKPVKKLVKQTTKKTSEKLELHKLMLGTINELYEANRDSKRKRSKAKETVTSKQTLEQKAGVDKKVLHPNHFEGFTKIDHLPFKEQLTQIFNPLHTITKTVIGDHITDATYIVPSKN